MRALNRLLAVAIVRAGLALAAGSASLPAYTMPPFELAALTQGATLIVSGELRDDGSLIVGEVLKGTAPSGPIALTRGDLYFTRLRARSNPTLNVPLVAFLELSREGNWTPFWNLAGLVNFAAAGAIGHQDGYEHGRDFPLSLSAPNFLAAVRAELDAGRVFAELTARPRSRERAADLVAFLLAHDRPLVAARDGDVAWHFYYLNHVAEALRPVAPEEEEDIAKALAQRADPRTRETLLKLARRLPLTPRTTGRVVPLLENSHPPAVRRAAMLALRLIDPQHVADYVASRLTLSEPELETALTALGNDTWPSSIGRLNPIAVAPLIQLAQAMAASPASRASGDMPVEQQLVQQALLGQLQHFAHPRFVPLLMDWAFADGRAYSDPALAVLQRVTGLKFTRAESEQWRAWWQQAEPRLQREYALGTPSGRLAWMRAWDESDLSTRRLLLRLWLFEPTIDESALIALAAGHESAREALADLWLRQRLSAEGRKATVQQLLRFRLTVQPPPLDSPFDDPPYYLRIIASTNFPFPAASVTVVSDITTDGRPPQLLLDRSESGPLTLHGAHGRAFRVVRRSMAQPPRARAVLQLEERDRDQGNPPLWTLRWTFDEVDRDVPGE